MDRLADKAEGRAMTPCPLCGGRMYDKRVTHPQNYMGKIIILENVPAEVCRQCGEVLLRPAILERLQVVVWSETTPVRTEQVPVYDISEMP